MQKASTVTQLAVEWALVGPQQQLMHWQCLTWDATTGKLTTITPIAETDTALRQQAKGTVALPGFVNAHAHLQLSTSQPIALPHSQTMGDWLLAVVKTMGQHTQAHQEALILSGIQQALATGTTTIASTISHFPLLFQLLETLPPMRTLWLLEWFHPDWAVDKEKITQLEATIRQGVFYLKTFAPAIQNRTSLGISPHSPYNVSIPAWQALQLSLIQAEITLPWQSHLLESTEELAYYQQTANSSKTSIDTVHQTLLGRTFTHQLSHPKDVVASLNEAQLLPPSLSVVHGLELTLQQAETLAEQAVSLVTCPRSNLFLHDKLIAETVLCHPQLTVAIGTDGHVSLPEPTVLDMRLELATLKQAYDWLGWEALLQLATLNGAKALGMAGDIGELSTGAYADITVWQLPANQSTTEATKEALLALVFTQQAPLIKTYVGGLVV